MVKIDKSKMYEIVDAYEKHFGEKKERAIGKKGKFLRFTQGMRFEFVYDLENNIGMHSSIVLDSELTDNNEIQVYTLNTVYVFKEVEDNERQE